MIVASWRWVVGGGGVGEISSDDNKHVYKVAEVGKGGKWGGGVKEERGWELKGGGGTARTHQQNRARKNPNLADALNRDVVAGGNRDAFPTGDGSAAGPGLARQLNHFARARNSNRGCRQKSGRQHRRGCETKRTSYANGPFEPQQEMRKYA